MISNERPSPYRHRSPWLPRPPVQEETLKTGQVEIEHKTFVLTLRQNPRGRFLRIIEKSVDAVTSVIIPGPGLATFKQRLDNMVKAARERGPAASLDPTHNPETERVQVERKSFVFALDQCPRGQILRIIETGTGGRSHELVILASGLEAFKNVVDEMVKAADEQPLPFITVTDTRPRTPTVDETLRTGQMQLERKTFTFLLKKNPRGRFLRIIEETEGRGNSVIIPAEGLEEFTKWVVDMAEAAKKLPE